MVSLTDPSVAHARERRRLAALDRLDRRRELPELAFDAMAVAAAAVAGTHSAQVSLVDDEKVWLKGGVGVSVCSLDRSGTLCDTVVAHGEELIVADTLADGRFAGLPTVAGDPHVRRYAGFPLRTTDGDDVGVLCVYDPIPGTLGPAQVEALRALASQAAAHIELHAALAAEWEHRGASARFEQLVDEEGSSRDLTGARSAAAGGWEFLTASRSIGQGCWQTSDPALGTIAVESDGRPELAQVLLALAAEGWELVTTAGEQLVCKRPRREQPAEPAASPEPGSDVELAALTAEQAATVTWPQVDDVDRATLTKLWSHLAAL